MAVPKHHELFNPLLKVLWQLGGSASIQEQEDEVASMLKLTESDLTQIHKGSQTKFSYNLAWARTWPKIYGLLDNSSRGVWSLTEQGQQTKLVEPTIVKQFVTAKYKKGTIKLEKLEPPAEDSNEQWKVDVLEYLQGMPPNAFERLCQRLLRESGFIQVEVTGRSGDGGIDGRGVVRLGGLLSFHMIFQCKRFKGSVGSSIVRDFRGAMVGRADKGLLITTGTFTKDARNEAQREGAPPIDLIDGLALADKLLELSLGIVVSKRVVEKIEVQKSFFDSF